MLAMISSSMMFSWRFRSIRREAGVGSLASVRAPGTVRVRTPAAALVHGSLERSYGVARYFSIFLDSARITSVRNTIAPVSQDP